MDSSKTTEKRRIRIALASPSDVAAERKIARKVIDELRDQFQAHLEIEVTGYEDVPAGIHRDGPQGQIDAHIRFEECAYVIGMFWRRFGRPTERGRAPTEHEIRIAFDVWKRKGRPQLLLYFSNQEYSPESKDDVEQRTKVLQFRDEFRDKGFVPDYKTSEEFEDKLRSDLTNYLQKEVRAQVNSQEGTPTDAATTRTQEPWRCVVSTSPRLVRSEGITELLGDIELSISGLAPGEPTGLYISADVQVILNVNLTNRRKADQASEARLTLDDGALIQGRLVANNSITFEGVPLCQAGIVCGRRATISNLRANASQLGPSSSAAQLNKIQAYVTLTTPAPISLENQVLIVGESTRAVEFFLDQPRSAAPPLALAGSTETTAGPYFEIPPCRISRVFVLTFRERYPYFFRNRFQELSREHGTRLVIWFFDVPESLRLLVSTREIGSSETAAKTALVFDANPNGYSPRTSPAALGPTKTDESIDGVPMAKLTVAGRLTFAVWEWISRDPGSVVSVDEVRFRLALAAEPGQEVRGVMQVRGCLGPIYTVTTSSEDAPVPRFVDSSDEPLIIVLD